MPAALHAFLCREDNIGVLIQDPETGACAAIDAPEEAAVLKALDETGWRLTDILVTHRHADHIEGIEPLKRRFGCRVVSPAKAADEIPGTDETVSGGATVRVGNLKAQVWDTPGHCRDHVAYWFSDDKVAFAGDTLFTLGCGRVMESTYEEMWASLLKFAKLPSETAIYSGHDYVLSNAKFALAVEPDNAALKARAEEARAASQAGRFLVPTTIGHEKATNPFLRAGEATVAHAVERDGDGAEAVFKALREWKNRFR